MKKIQTLLIMFSLFFLFSFSYAATATVTIIDSNGVATVYEDTDDALTSNKSITFDLRNYQWTQNYTDYVFYRRDNFVYQIDFFNMSDEVKFYYDDTAMHGTTPYKILVNVSNGVQHDFGTYGYLAAATSSVSSKAQMTTGKIFVNSSISLKLLDSTVPIYKGDFVGSFNSSFNPHTECIFTDEVVLSGSSSEPTISMKNPLTDAEIKNILEIFLGSVRNADLPEHYGRYVLTYDKITGRYTGFVYPSYIDLGIKYCDFDENDELYIVENSTGSYYLFTSYSEDSNYISQFLDGINLGMKHPLLYEFRSNSNNTYFKFNTTYDLGRGFENSFVLSTLDEPIIYTSHKIYSLFLTGTDILGFGKYEVDEETSIENQVFTDEETGLPKDTTINEYTDEVNSNVNLLSFIQLLFGFIFSFISFLVRFFTFLVSFIVVPASTTILPSEFVTGIDWLHSFAFGDILLWDIFSILFSVLLSIYIVKLIRSH